MGDKPGKYWDYNECRWVKCPTPAEDAAVPAQSSPGDDPAAEVREAPLSTAK